MFPGKTFACETTECGFCCTVCRRNTPTEFKWSSGTTLELCTECMNTEQFRHLGASAAGLDLETSIPKIPKIVHSLGANLVSMLDVPRFSDITIKCKDDEEIHCHRIILVYRLCSNDYMKDDSIIVSNAMEIVLTLNQVTFTKETIMPFLQYLYSGVIDMYASAVEASLEVARFFSNDKNEPTISPFIEWCESSIANGWYTRLWVFTNEPKVLARRNTRGPSAQVEADDVGCL